MRRLGSVATGVAVLLAGVAVASSGGARQTEARWVITDLGTLGGKTSEAVAINDRGAIVGSSDTRRGISQAFLRQNGRMRDLGTLGHEASGAVAINGNGQIVGWSGADEWHDPHAFLWQDGGMRRLLRRGASTSDSVAGINDRGQIALWADTASGYRSFLWEQGKVIDLGTLDKRAVYSRAAAINEQASVVGSSVPPGRSPAHPFLWHRGRMIDLGASPTGKYGEAVDINEAGQVIGNTYAGWDETFDEEPYPSRAFLWEKGRMSRPGTLGGRFRNSYAVAINDRGQVIGTDQPGEGWLACRSFLWQRGRTIDLGALPRRRCSVASDINEHGQVVGNSYVDYPSDLAGEVGSHAFLWEKGKMTDLGALARGKRSWAVAINDRGQIVGYAVTKSGDSHAVLWTLKRG